MAASIFDGLTALSRKTLDSDDARKMIAALSDGPRSFCGHFGITLVDELLTETILTRLIDLDTEQRREFVRSELSTLNAKILLGRALGLFDGETKYDLTLIRHIRNAFAHGGPMLSFDDPAIARACDTLKWLRAMKLFRETLTSPRRSSALLFAQLFTRCLHSDNCLQNLHWN
jgi:hypothetical protein